MSDDLKSLETRIGHRFVEPDLLVRALTHSSVAVASGVRDYERLEFLGDRVLGLVIADLLLKRFPAEDEGDLAVRLNALVRAETCTDVARDLDLSSFVRLTPGEEKAGAGDRSSVLADICEALIGALYLDGGLEVARTFIEAWWLPKLEGMKRPPRDAKTELQEWAQGKKLGLPKYTEVSRSGPDHAPEFEVKVSVADIAPVVASGSSKRVAEQAAAEAMLLREGIR
ncbi:MAG: ribonuclease III [Parvibaculum sp.]